MGRVKLRFGALVFLHGTPLEESIGTAASHACVRMRNADAIELARLIHSVAQPTVAASTIDSLLARRGSTRAVQLQTPIPLRVRYEVAEVRGDSVLVHPDVYHRAGRVQEAVTGALIRHGYVVETMDRATLDALVAAARAGHASTSIDSLVRRPLEPESLSFPVYQP